LADFAARDRSFFGEKIARRAKPGNIGTSDTIVIAAAQHERSVPTTASCWIGLTAGGSASIPAQVTDG